MTKTNRTKAYSYLRFSTPEQMQGDSFRRQTQLAQSYAERHGLVLDEQLAFEDLGMSAYKGKNARVGALRNFLDLVEEEKIAPGSHLLVESLDRISREQILSAQGLFLQIIQSGIVLVTLTDNKVYSAESVNANPMDLMYSLLIMMRAHEESSMKSRRLKASWESKRANAKTNPLTSRVPAWLELDKEAGEIRIIEEKASVVRRIFQMTLDGTGQNKIAETLNQEGIPVFGRGKHWHRSYVAKLLSNTAVIGTLTPHRLEYVDGRRKRISLSPIEAYYPAIIDQITYDRARAMRLGTVNPQRGRHAQTNLQNLFGGLAKCPLCGSTMTRVSKGKHGKAGRPKLVCSRAKTGAGCQYRSVPYDEAEAAFLRDASYLLGTIPAGSDDPEVDQAITDSEAGISALEDALERLLDAIQRGKSPAVMDRVRQVENELEQMRKDHDDLLELQALTTNPMVYHKAEDLIALLEIGELDRGLANALLRQMMTGVTVDYRSGMLVFHWLHGGETRIAYGWPEEG